MLIIKQEIKKNQFPKKSLAEVKLVCQECSIFGTKILKNIDPLAAEVGIFLSGSQI
jgi:hypothetical protein